MIHEGWRKIIDNHTMQKSTDCSRAKEPSCFMHDTKIVSSYYWVVSVVENIRMQLLLR